MPLEIARRLVAGVWRTGSVDEPDGGGGGGSLTVTDGGTTVVPVTEIDFARAAVADGGNGIASVTVDAGIPQGGPLDTDLDAGDNKITGLRDPDDDQDAATKLYVDDSGIQNPLSEDLVSGGHSLRGSFGAVVRGGSFLAANPSGDIGGDAGVTGGRGASGAAGGNATLIGGGGDNEADVGCQVIANAGDGSGNPGRLAVITDNEGGTAGQVLMSDGNGGVVWADLP